MNDAPDPTNAARCTAKWKWVVAIVVAVFALVGIGVAVAYHSLTSGGLRARQTPSALEVFVAGRLVNWSIPSEARARKNPLSAEADGTDAAAGRELYQKDCEACHGYDGKGRTDAGGGLYPPPLNLQPAAVARRNRT